MSTTTTSSWFAMRRSKRKHSNVGMDKNTCIRITTQFNNKSSSEASAHKKDPKSARSLAQMLIPSFSRKRSHSMSLFSPPSSASPPTIQVETPHGENEGLETSNMTAEQFARAIGLPVLAFTDEQDDILARTETMESIQSLTLTRHFTDMSLEDYKSVPPATAPAQQVLQNLIMKSPPMTARPLEEKGTEEQCSLGFWSPPQSEMGFATSATNTVSSTYASSLFSPAQLPADIMKQRISPPKLDMSLFVPPTPEPTPPPSDSSTVSHQLPSPPNSLHVRVITDKANTYVPQHHRTLSSPSTMTSSSSDELTFIDGFASVTPISPFSKLPPHINSFHRSTLGPIAGSPSVEISETDIEYRGASHPAPVNQKITLPPPPSNMYRRSHRRCQSEGDEYFRRQSAALEKVNEEFVKVEKRGRFTVTREASSHWRPRNRTQRTYTRFQPVLDDPKPTNGLVIAPSPILTSPTARFLHLLQQDQLPTVAETPSPVQMELFMSPSFEKDEDLTWKTLARRQQSVDSGVSDMS